MFEKYLVHPKGFKNVRRNGEVVGYEVQLRIPYYRGIPMSCVQEIEISVDNEKASHQGMWVTVKDQAFKYEELSTVIHHRWEMIDTITVFVNKPGGLTEGEHEVYGYVSLRISYQPHPNVGENTKVLTLEKEKVI